LDRVSNTSYFRVYHTPPNHPFSRFIHGGAWCDPLQDSKELQPALTQLLNDKAYAATLDHIAGFASIDYGLSGNTTGDMSLDVKHPQHRLDVIRALEWLRKEYHVGVDKKEKGWDWIAVGHSCGATLAMQICMSYSQPWSSGALGAWAGTSPVAVVGLEGIYDLPLLNQTHIDQPVYASFLTNAFGSDEKVWRNVSPVEGDYKRAYNKGGMKLVLLAHSDDDELVEWEQTHALRKCLVNQGWKFSDSDDRDSNGSDAANKLKYEEEVRILKLSGSHDEVWSKGDGVRTAIAVAVRKLFS
jgi:kynurenine formamidase